MTYKIFIDGAEGTTGLAIHSYFENRDDIELLHIDEAHRKDKKERLAMIKKADVSFLCLPDEAAKEIASEAPADARLIDTSTAHRTNKSWVYGMPEISQEQRERIKTAARVAVPGCHATGVILLIRPLIQEKILSKDYPFAAFSVTGYSGGGKKMIKQYMQGEVSTSPRQYGLAQSHKHLPEIMAVTGLEKPPAFMPVVSDYYKGMQVTIPIKGSSICAPQDRRLAEALSDKGPKAMISELFKKTYENQMFVHFNEDIKFDGFINADRLAGSNTAEITVEGNDENILLIASYDNLGKGASGAAVQNMNIMLGIDERKGLL